MKELSLMKEHFHSAHTQFRAFKKARKEAMTEDDTITIQIDWSENAKLVLV